MHHCGFVVVYGGFVVRRLWLKFVEEELETAVVWVIIVDGDTQRSVVHIFPTSVGVCHGIVDEHQQAKGPHSDALGDPTRKMLWVKVTSWYLTTCFLLDRKFVNYDIKLGWSPELIVLMITVVLGTRSNALWKSMMVRATNV